MIKYSENSGLKYESADHSIFWGGEKKVRLKQKQMQPQKIEY